MGVIRAEPARVSDWAARSIGAAWRSFDLQLAAYAGLVPSTRSSGDKTRHGQVGRGNPWLKWLLIEALQTLKLAPGPVGNHYKKMLRAKGKPKATVAAARKFCTYLYWMLKEEWSYTEWLRQHDRPEVRPMQPLGSAA